jgi:octanoyl-[GcvH]:protein N-octanoyltransferase
MQDNCRFEEWTGIREWRVLDTSGAPLAGDIVLPFAVDELACAEVAAGSPPLLHLWRHRKALVLGLRDRKLPRASEAMAAFRQEGYSVMVRNSGGAAVPLDEGVLNVTLVVPARPGAVDVRREFAAMADFVRRAVHRLDPALEIAVGEVGGAYCPGDYDLSAGGRKFCGIAQRRKLGAYAVQAFIVAEGGGEDRARTAARFYRMSAGDGAGQTGLTVLPESTASLREWSDRVTAAGLAESFKDLLRKQADIRSEARHYDGYDGRMLEAMIGRMKARYDTD